MWLSALLAANLNAQQVADSNFKPPIAEPAYAVGKGPVVFIDEAHFNFHTATGRYLVFAELLRRDGYVVKASKVRFSKKSLKPAKILVIANALHESNSQSWTLPTPSAFTDEEVAAVREWVREGGALLLIADHMPFPGAAEKLAAAFDVRFSNGYVLKQNQAGGANAFSGGPDVFRLSDKTLAEHPIIAGRSAAERVDSVATFTGSAFQAGTDARPLLILGQPFVSLLTAVAGQFTPETPRQPVGGWLQGATLKSGKGRVALFGEAAMFSAQLAGPNRQPMGMNAPIASQNARFLLNVMHWLSGGLEP